MLVVLRGARYAATGRRCGRPCGPATASRRVRRASTRRPSPKRRVARPAVAVLPTLAVAALGGLPGNPPDELALPGHLVAQLTPAVRVRLLAKETVVLPDPRPLGIGVALERVVGLQEHRALRVAAPRQPGHDLAPSPVPLQQAVRRGIPLTSAQRLADARRGADRAGTAVVDERHDRVELVLVEVDVERVHGRAVFVIEVSAQELARLRLGQLFGLRP